MKFAFHPEAEKELGHSIDYYTNIKSELGYDFATEVYLAIERAALLPDAWQIIDGDIRRVLLNRFPYGVLYSEIDKNIYIVAVMPLHREPDYWQHRT